MHKEKVVAIEEETKREGESCVNICVMCGGVLHARHDGVPLLLPSSTTPIRTYRRTPGVVQAVANTTIAFADHWTGHFTHPASGYLRFIRNLCLRDSTSQNL